MTTDTQSERQYQIETQTALVGDDITVPYHSVGISIRQIIPFSDTVLVSYLVPTDGDHSEGPGEGNTMTINELVFGLDDRDKVELPFYATGTTIFDPDNDESTFVYYLT